ncbi:MAG TPA: hypothetical protein PLV45_04690 [bacterium]|nr:hypothetical protein [bacterium]
MNRRGFTVLEALVALVLIMSVGILITRTIRETRTAVHRSEVRADITGDMVRALQIAGNGIMTMSRSGPRIFEPDRLQFRIAGSSEDHRMEMVRIDGATWEIRMNGRSVHEFQGQAAFQYLSGDTWVDRMPPDVMPRAVAIRLYHARDPGNTPWERVVNTPASIPVLQRVVPEMPGSEATGI